MNAQQKALIDGLSYVALLQHWKHHTLGDRLLQGDAGVYYATEMARKRSSLTQGELEAADRSLGWYPKTNALLHHALSELPASS